MAEELQAKLVAIGLEPKLAQTTVTNKKISDVIAAVLAEANAPPCTPTVGKLLYHVACKVLTHPHRLAARLRRRTPLPTR